MDLSVEQLQRQFDTGPVACLRTMQACYPHLKGRDGARVINFASSVGIKGTAGFAPYAMAKEAIRGLTRVAAREWGADGLPVNKIGRATCGERVLSTGRSRMEADAQKKKHYRIQ